MERINRAWENSPEYEDALIDWLYAELVEGKPFVNFEDSGFYRNARYAYRQRVNG